MGSENKEYLTQEQDALNLPVLDKQIELGAVLHISTNSLNFRKAVLETEEFIKIDYGFTIPQALNGLSEMVQFDLENPYNLPRVFSVGADYFDNWMNNSLLPNGQRNEIYSFKDGEFCSPRYRDRKILDIKVLPGGTFSEFYTRIRESYRARGI